MKAMIENKEMVQSTAISSLSFAKAELNARGELEGVYAYIIMDVIDGVLDPMAMVELDAGVLRLRGTVLGVCHVLRIDVAELKWVWQAVERMLVAAVQLAGGDY